MEFSDFRVRVAEVLADTVNDDDGWLSDAQNADLNLEEDSFVEFSGYGSIDIQHIASIAFEVLTTLIQEQEKDR